MSDASTARHDIEENPSSIGAWTSRTQITAPRKLANSSVELRGLNNFLGRMECSRSTDFCKAILDVPRPSCLYKSAVVVFDSRCSAKEKRAEGIAGGSSAEDISAQTKLHDHVELRVYVDCVDNAKTKPTVRVQTR